MTQENKELLLKDLCARLPYGVICHYNCAIPLDGRFLKKANAVDSLRGILPRFDGHIDFMVGSIDKVNALEGDIKPYLRPMSSMTDEEKDTFQGFIYPACNDPVSMIDWLNAHHFDYRGLIEKGLALEAKEGMYETE